VETRSPALDVGPQLRNLGLDPREHPEDLGPARLAVGGQPADGAIVAGAGLLANDERQPAALALTGLWGGGYRGCRRGMEKAFVTP
jgi:hypothetical protein